jgi:hypothetical protein
VLVDGLRLVVERVEGNRIGRVRAGRVPMPHDREEHDPKPAGASERS